MRPAAVSGIKKLVIVSTLLFLGFWPAAPIALAVPGASYAPSGSFQQTLKVQNDLEQKAQFDASMKTPPPISAKCAAGPVPGSCMADYCGTDVGKVVTACFTAAEATAQMGSWQIKCWKGYNCTGAKGMCCVIPSAIAGECYWDYVGNDKSQVTFKCVPDSDTCKSKYPGAMSLNSGFGCPTGICCKMGKSAAQLSESSACYFDYSGGDKDKVHFVCTNDDNACKSQSGTPSGKGMSCQNKDNTCCKLAGARSALANITPRTQVPINTFCFTSKECVEASGSSANWKKGQGCVNKGGEPQGYCIAPEPDYDLQYPIFGVKTIRGLKNFIALLFNTGIGIIVVASALFFIWGAVKYMVSAVGAEITTAKSTMIDSLIGLALGLGAYAILANINPNTLNLKTYEIKMINRLSFYNLKYCRDIPQPQGSKPLMFMDAGLPDKPKDFQSQLASEGYKTDADNTVCGNEYFIEGSSATDVCMGGGCKGGGVCVNCSGGADKCKTTSAYEAVCATGVIAGNVVSKTEGDEISADFVCMDPNTGETWTKELGSTSLGLGQTGNAGSSGFVGHFIMYNISAEDVTENFKDCASDKKVGGVVLVAQMRSKSTLEAQTVLDRRYILNKKVCSQRNFDICGKAGAPTYVVGSETLSAMFWGWMIAPAFIVQATIYGVVKDVMRGGLGGFFERAFTSGTVSQASVLGIIQKNGFTENDLLGAINNKKTIECSFKCNYDASEFALNDFAAFAIQMINLSGN